MQVEAPSFRNVKDLSLNEVAVIKREKDVRIQLLNLFYPEGMIDVRRCENRYTVFGSKLGHRIEPNRFLRMISMRKHGDNLKAMFQTRFDPYAPDVTIGQYDSSHQFALTRQSFSSSL